MKARLLGFAIAALVLAAAPAGAESPRERAQKLIKKLTKDKDADVRAEAASSLGDMRAWDAVPELAMALEDPSPRVRANASYALGRLEEKAREAVPAMKKALGDSDSLVRLNVAVALSNMEAATAAELTPALTGLMSDPDKETREKAVRMLWNLGFEADESRAALLDALERGRPDVRNTIMGDLWKLGFRGHEPWAQPVIARLVAMTAKDADPKLRRLAIVSLRALRPMPAAVGEAMLKALEDDDAEVRAAAAASLNSIEEGGFAQKAVARLVQTMRTGPTPGERKNAARALANMMGRRELFIAAMAEALAKEKDELVRVAIAESLGTLRGEEGIAPLLLAIKSDASPRVRAAACRALPELSQVVLQRVGKLDSALAALDAAAKDPDADVAAAAQTAAGALRR